MNHTAAINFNPRLREGGDSQWSVYIERQSISIHASEKEATYNFLLPFHYKRISIHASEKEATILFFVGYNVRGISIHASEKEATGFGKAQIGFILISIHASEKEATHIVQCLPYACFYFNPRLREGGDCNIL